MANRAARMLPRASALGLFLLLGCSGGEVSEEPAAEATPDIPGDQQVRTADPYARGYTDEDFPRVQELAPGVFSYEQLRSAGDERFTTVSLFVVTDEGVVVADGQGSVEETQRMVDHIATITDLPITDVVVCSDHGDHTAGNDAFPEDVTYHAHPFSLATVNRAAAIQGRDAPTWATTAEEVSTEATLSRGGREIQIHFLGRAHTGGDLVVYMPEEKILFMSEAYLHRIFPAMRTAFPSEWVDMIEAAQAMDVDVYVPGHGFVDHPSILDDELELFQGAIRAVIAEARLMHEEGFDL
ncbi:MAG: MBL fold metallo-hydrolase, partial [Gemmatimonadota bacterium]